ncbi:hypothetical protein JNUCC1_03329 [Lentibacillus sp. JNUCC-1]|uniref:hypothetical protein n=1 Tax=Lentibacillus sp. JNUCC-1 TaxID=2654513 RepID=UPI0012E96888|nr:hypothetical protein [Lentibacillus sp. JNUCC-1]MUV39451.1 hypothetical protein [Lentibacillus sp. JNUCC-1]
MNDQKRLEEIKNHFSNCADYGNVIGEQEEKLLNELYVRMRDLEKALVRSYEFRRDAVSNLIECRARNIELEEINLEMAVRLNNMTKETMHRA